MVVFPSRYLCLLHSLIYKCTLLPDDVQSLGMYRVWLTMHTMLPFDVDAQINLFDAMLFDY